MEMCYDGALVMPGSYAVMSEEEMTYLDGGTVIAKLTMDSDYCNTAYNIATKYSTFQGVSGTLIQYAVGVALARWGVTIGLTGAAVTVCGLAMSLTSYFSKYKVMVNAFNKGAINNGITIMFFSTGDISYKLN